MGRGTCLRAREMGEDLADGGRGWGRWVAGGTGPGGLTGGRDGV
jgi:hypothetical protein